MSEIVPLARLGPTHLISRHRNEGKSPLSRWRTLGDETRFKERFSRPVSSLFKDLHLNVALGSRRAAGHAFLARWRRQLAPGDIRLVKVSSTAVTCAQQGIPWALNPGRDTYPCLGIYRFET